MGEVIGYSIGIGKTNYFAHVDYNWNCYTSSIMSDITRNKVYISAANAFITVDFIYNHFLQNH